MRKGQSSRWEPARYQLCLNESTMCNHLSVCARLKSTLMPSGDSSPWANRPQRCFHNWEHSWTALTRTPLCMRCEHRIQSGVLVSAVHECSQLWKHRCGLFAQGDKSPDGIKVDFRRAQTERWLHIVDSFKQSWYRAGSHLLDCPFRILGKRAFGIVRLQPLAQAFAFKTRIIRKL